MCFPPSYTFVLPAPMVRSLHSSTSRCELTEWVSNPSYTLAPVEGTFRDPECRHYILTTAILDMTTTSEEPFAEESVAKMSKNLLGLEKGIPGLRVSFPHRRKMHANQLRLMLWEACHSRVYPESHHYLPIGQR